jgi:ABC-type lipoprotein release transport system permease subunit
MGRLLLIAARNLWQQRRRTLLLGAAIAAVTSLLVLLTSVSNGIQDTMLRAATTLSTGHVNVGGFFKVTTGVAAPVVTRYQPLKALVEREIPEARLVVDRMRGWGKVVSPATSIQAGIMGVDVQSERELSEVLSIVQGELQGLKRPNTMLIFEKQAERLEVGVGDMLTISAQTTRGAANALDVEVVAIARDMGLISSFNVFTPKQTVRELYLLDRHTTGAIQIYLDEPEQAAVVASRLRPLLTKAGQRVMEPEANPFWMKFPLVTREDWTGQKLDVTTWKDEMKFLTWIITAFDAITAVLVGILLVIIVVGVMNVLWITIRERTREIGTLRAIGMTRGRVLMMFLVEGALLSVSATTIGAVIGAGGSALLDAANLPLSGGFALFLMSDTLRLVVAPQSVTAALVTIATITTLFSLWPAYRAARMRPVTAIHHVG